MRTIRTIILRLMTDTDQPQSLRGLLQDVADSEQHHFTDEQTLLALLHYFSSSVSASPGDGDEEGTASDARS